MSAGSAAAWRSRAVVTAGLAVSGGLLAYLLSHNLAALLRVGSELSWGWAAAAAAAALLSYACIGLALSEVLRILGHGLPFGEVLGIALVSTTANYFVSSAGASGFALKAHLLRKRRVPYATVVTASVLSTAILYIVLAVIICQGLGYLLLHLRGTRFALMESIAGLGLLLAVTVPMLAFFFHRRFRNRIALALFHALNRGAYLFSKSEIPREEFEDFEAQFARGLQEVRRHKGRLTKTIAYTALDWALAMLTLYFSLRAVGVEVPIGHLSAGFTAAQAATLIPVLPGGLGAVEASLAAVFQGLGVDFESAVVAALVYRFSYYVLPGAASVFVLWGLKVSEPGWAEHAVESSTQKT